ncbi:nickel-dependent hydrogenase large subunit [Mycobacterium sp. 94-17]|uniref:hydrogenase large subunit n=1 Tax=Mycobacterium sp. 94-17 TaxID=2986147 RepID=UPI002D1F5D9C|nr:nickel-dependent hydrogenase large subunit [Mycobacterium sp. 94-17]MEB4211200.1 nickel-dependent hydrogenase large subunit [Mycobacterium sp. 94-17]
MTSADLATWQAMLPDQARTVQEDGVVRVPVSVGELPATVQQLGANARLADMFADHQPGADPVLRSVWALDGSTNRYLVTETACSTDEYPSLSVVEPAAFVEECEIYEQFGLRPADGGQLNRIALPPYAEVDFPRLGRIPTREAAGIRAPHTVGGEAFEFPFGPVRAVGFESLYYGLVTSGEEVVDLYLFTWHKYRGIEWRLRGMHPRQALFLIERAEGLSAASHAWAFAAAIETALGISVAPAASRIRAAAVELERIYNHVAAIAALCQSTGLAVAQANSEIILESLLRVGARFFGHRYLFGVIDIGGVARRADLRGLSAETRTVCADLRHVTDGLDSTNSFLDRLEATGIITAAQAASLGLVGPVARASGLSLDTRRDHLQPPYDNHPVTVARASRGDVRARYHVFLSEINEAVTLIDELALSDCSIDGQPAPIPRRAGSGLGWAESPRGEALVWVELDPDGRISRCRLRPAAVRNWRAFGDAARSQNVFTDVPIIEASFWLTAAGRAR